MLIDTRRALNRKDQLIVHVQCLPGMLCFGCFRVDHGDGARKTTCYGEHHCEATMYFFQATAWGSAGNSHKGHKLYITSMAYGIRSPYCNSKGYMLPILLRGGNHPKEWYTTNCFFQWRILVLVQWVLGVLEQETPKTWQRHWGIVAKGRFWWYAAMASFSVFIGANKAEMFLLDTAHALATLAVKDLFSSQTFPILMMEMGSLTGSQTCQGSDCDDAFALAGGPLDVDLWLDLPLIPMFASLTNRCITKLWSFGSTDFKAPVTCLNIPKEGIAQTDPRICCTQIVRNC